MDYFPVLSRLVGVKAGGRPGLWHCRCPVADRHQGGDRRPSGRVWVDEQTGKLCCWCGKGCKWREWVAATGTGIQDWFPVADRPPGRRVKKVSQKVVATFDYVDERGTLLYQVCRTDPKGFFQRRPLPDKTRGIPEWSYELGDVRKVPYRLPELMDPAKVAHPVLIAEGEGKVDLLRGLGFVATCAAGGAGKWPVQFGGHLVGRRVVILPDRDDVGTQHAADVAASCLIFGAASIRVVRYGKGWEDMPEKSDVKDWLEKAVGATGGLSDEVIRNNKRHALVSLIKLQPEWKAVAA